MYARPLPMSFTPALTPAATDMPKNAAVPSPRNGMLMIQKGMAATANATSPATTGAFKPLIPSTYLSFVRTN